MTYRRLLIRRHPVQGFELIESVGEGEPPTWRRIGRMVMPHFGAARWVAKQWYERNAWEGTMLVLTIEDRPRYEPKHPTRKVKGLV